VRCLHLHAYFFQELRQCEGALEFSKRMRESTSPTYHLSHQETESRFAGRYMTAQGGAEAEPWVRSPINRKPVFNRRQTLAEGVSPGSTAHDLAASNNSMMYAFRT